MKVFSVHVLQECQTRATNWKHRLEEAVKLWRHLQEKAKLLENWISSAEHALNALSDDNSSVELSVCLQPYLTCTFCFVLCKVVYFSIF